MYDGVKIIIDAFEREVFGYECCSRIDVNYDLETYGLTDKELQMFRKLFSYANPNEFWNTLIDADEEKYGELLNDLKIKQKVLNEQVDTKTGIKRRKLLKLVETIKDTLNSVEENPKIPDLGSEESAKKKEGQGLKILTPNQILNRNPISLAQLKEGNNSGKLKNEIRQLLYS